MLCTYCTKYQLVSSASYQRGRAAPTVFLQEDSAWEPPGDGRESPGVGDKEQPEAPEQPGAEPTPPAQPTEGAAPPEEGFSIPSIAKVLLAAVAVIIVVVVIAMRAMKPKEIVEEKPVRRPYSPEVGRYRTIAATTRAARVWLW